MKKLMSASSSQIYSFTSNSDKTSAKTSFSLGRLRQFGSRDNLPEIKEQVQVDGRQQQQDTSKLMRMRKLLSSPLTTRKKGGEYRTFGVGLGELCQRAESGRDRVPFIVTRICQYIENHGRNAEGIFRVNGSSKVVDKLKSSFDKYGNADFEECGDVYSVASLLKLFLRELPEPLIPPALQTTLLETWCVTEASELLGLKVLVSTLPPDNFALLQYLTRFLLSLTLNQAATKMNPKAFGIVFGPTIFRLECEGGDVMSGLSIQGHVNRITSHLISHHHHIFTSPSSHKPQPPARPPPPRSASTQSLNVPSPSQPQSGHEERQKPDTKNPRLDDDGGGVTKAVAVIHYVPTLSPRPTPTPIPTATTSTSHTRSVLLQSTPSQQPSSTPPQPPPTSQQPSSTPPEPPPTPQQPSSTPPEPPPTPKQPLSTPPKPPEPSSEPSSTPSQPPSTLPEPPSTPPEPSSTPPEPSFTPPEPSSTPPEPSSTPPEPSSTQPEPSSTLCADASVAAPKQSEVRVGSDPDDTMSSSDKPPSLLDSARSSEVPSPNLSPTSTKFCQDLIDDTVDQLLFPQSLDTVEGSGSQVTQRSGSQVTRESGSQVTRESGLQVTNRSGSQVTHGGGVKKQVDKDTGGRSREKRVDVHMSDVLLSSDGEESGGSKEEEEEGDLDTMSEQEYVKQNEGQMNRISFLNQIFSDTEEGDGEEELGRVSPVTVGVERTSPPLPKPTLVPELDLAGLTGSEEEVLVDLSTNKWYSGLPSTDDEDVILSPRDKMKMRNNSNSDPSAPPSPPVLDSSDNYRTFRRYSLPQKSHNDSVALRQLHKKMKSLKRKINKFEEEFARKHGYKPSKKDKLVDATIKKCVLEQMRIKKELKYIRSEQQREAYGDDIRVDGGGGACQEHVLTAMQQSLEEAMERLECSRSGCLRPHKLEDMVDDEVWDEKVALQKVLLEFEKQHGRPSSKAEKDLMRPMYDRYRSVKRIMKKRGRPSLLSMSVGSKTDLQPIIEGEEVDVAHIQHHDTAASPRVVINHHYNDDEVMPESESEQQVMHSPGLHWMTCESQADVLTPPARHSWPCADAFLSPRNLPLAETGSPDNIHMSGSGSQENIHNASLSQLIQMQEKSRQSKRRLKKVLKDFEEDFHAQNGRKLHKEDRVPLQHVYEEYKQVKAKLRLIDALLSKHHSEI